MTPNRRASRCRTLAERDTGRRQDPLSIPSVRMFTKLRYTLELVRFSHSIFALPFALGTMLVAAHGLPPWPIVIKILIAMIAARTMAMAFNRWLDAEIDARNPRTADRHIPAGILSRHYVLGLTIVMAVIFVLTCLMINPLSFYLSPIAIVILMGYSYCKRFTHLSHFVLGLALGISPVGAWIAVTGQFSWVPIFVCAAVILWVSGFDVVYAIQDEAFDRATGLHSLVVRLGAARTVRLTQILHALMLPLFLAFGIVTPLGLIYYIAVAAILGISLAIHRRIHGIYITGTIPDTPQQANILLMLNGLTGLAFLLGSALSSS